MIIVNLMGGMANQMFQYAFVRAFSLRHGVEMRLDASGYPQTDLRTYSLGNFNIVEKLATPEELRKIKYRFGVLSKAERYLKRTLFRTLYYDFDPALLKYRDNAYFQGFLQCEKYFWDAREVILRDFTLSKEPGSEARLAAEKIKSAVWPISLHVRRSDYVEDPRKSRIFGGCSLDYYRRAADIIVGKYPEASFFVLSDDIAWVKENLRLPYPTSHLSSPVMKDYEELNLISLCRHHIIANSSFSWWGAWLNDQPDKMVIAPAKWTNRIPNTHPNIVPNSWLRIPN